jgi:hypothetical protein
MQDQRIRLDVMLKQDRARSRAANNREHRLRRWWRSIRELIARPARTAENKDRRGISGGSGRCRTRGERGDFPLLGGVPVMRHSRPAAATNDRGRWAIDRCLRRQSRHSRMRLCGSFRRFG